MILFGSLAMQPRSDAEFFGIDIAGMAARLRVRACFEIMGRAEKTGCADPKSYNQRMQPVCHRIPLLGLNSCLARNGARSGRLDRAFCPCRVRSPCTFRCFRYRRQVNDPAAGVWIPRLRFSCGLRAGSRGMTEWGTPLPHPERTQVWQSRLTAVRT